MKAFGFKMAAMTAGLLPACVANAADERPNIVVIIADDLLSTEIGCYGGTNISTPNIDRIAREGILFRHNYASASMSVPIRASMYTGLYPARHGSYQNHKNTFEGTKTVNWYMPREGYRVGRTGKDHPGPKSVYVFDEIPGFTVNCTAQKAPYSVDGIREWISRDNDPFLLYVCSINTHAPWTWGDPSEFDTAKLKMPENCVDSEPMREIFTHYLAELRCLDNEVGSVLQTLEETGKLDNTIVLFLGEQGPQFPGGKWTLWYPGCHSALLARYPSKIEAGSTCDAIVQYEDLLPTFIDIAGGKPKEELDGISFKKALFGETQKGRKYAFGIHNNFPEGSPYPIRSIRDERYALLLNLTPEVDYFEKHLMNAVSPTGVWKAWTDAAKTDPKAAFWKDRYVTRPAVEFYDLQNDPWEEHNLANEPQYAQRIATMKAALLQWMEQQGDTGASMDIEFTNLGDRQKDSITAHSESVFIKKGWIRDPYIILGPDNNFYLTGTVTKADDPREKGDKSNTGLGTGSIVGNQFRIWRSASMVDWQDLGPVYELPYIEKKKNVIWAPELVWTGSRWAMVHCPGGRSELLLSEGSDVKGPWKAVPSKDFQNRHDPSLFQDDDGAWYLVYGYHSFFIARLKDDLSGFQSKPVAIGPSNRVLGHEGTCIRKIGDKYVLFGTAWSTDEGRNGTYNLYYCTADKITGPYGPRQFAGRYLGHGTPFKDKRGRWWCTAFYNADINGKAYTINPQGTTLVPMEVKVRPDGDISIKALDERYTNPGKDEVQKFK